MCNLVDMRQTTIPSKTTRSRNWIVVGYDENRPFDENDDLFTYGVMQREICPTTQRVHWQAYAECKNPITMSALLKHMIHGTHVEPRMARTGEQAANYCKKTESAIPDTQYEFGKIRNAPGVKSNDDEAVDVIELARNPETTWNDMLDEHPGFALRHDRAISRIMQERRPAKRYRDVKVSVVWGKTGVGKTRRIVELEQDNLYLKDNSQWWDHYDQHQAVLFDDFYGQHRVSEMLRWLDGYHVQLNVKGGHTWLHATRIYITSNHPPELWYPSIDNEVRAALNRRINTIEHICA